MDDKILSIESEMTMIKEQIKSFKDSPELDYHFKLFVSMFAELVCKYVGEVNRKLNDLQNSNITLSKQLDLEIEKNDKVSIELKKIKKYANLDSAILKSHSDDFNSSENPDDKSRS